MRTQFGEAEPSPVPALLALRAEIIIVGDFAEFGRFESRVFHRREGSAFGVRGSIQYSRGVDYCTATSYFGFLDVRGAWYMLHDDFCVLASCMARRHPRAYPHVAQIKATVRPEKLREALKEKTLHAALHLVDLSKGDLPEFNGVEPKRFATGFVSSAHGVWPVAQTFYENYRAGKFDLWHERWKATSRDSPSELELFGPPLSHTERKLWEYIHDARRFDEHGDGPEWIWIDIPITQGLGFTPGNGQSSKGGVRLKAYAEIPVSTVCAEYLALCGRFVDAFLRDNAHLIPS